MASNAELHSLICILQFMDLSPKTAMTMLTSVAKSHILAVIKHKVHPNYKSNIYKSANKI